MGRNCEIMTIFAGVLWQKPAYGWRRILHQKNRPDFPSRFSLLFTSQGVIVKKIYGAGDGIR